MRNLHIQTVSKHKRSNLPAVGDFNAPRGKILPGQNFNSSLALKYIQSKGIKNALR